MSPLLLPMTEADAKWYRQQKAFAENYLFSFIQKSGLDGRKFEPEKPDVYIRSINATAAMHDWIQNINFALMDAYVSINNRKNIERPARLETHAPGVRHASQFKPGLAFDNNKDFK